MSAGRATETAIARNLRELAVRQTTAGAQAPLAALAEITDPFLTKAGTDFLLASVVVAQ